MKDFIFRRSWFSIEFGDRSGSRFPTMKAALNLFLQNGRKTILETGCVRMEDDFGAGYSTYLFGSVAQKFNRLVVTVDIDQKNINLCKQVTQKFQNNIIYNVADSHEYLKSFTDWDSVGMIYLDSLDVPINGEDATPSQIHHKEEFLICESHILPETVLLLDDNEVWDSAGHLIDGKPKLLKEHLINKPDEWKCIMDYQQSLWIRI